MNPVEFIQEYPTISFLTAISVPIWGKHCNRGIQKIKKVGLAYRAKIKEILIIENEDEKDKDKLRKKIATEARPGPAQSELFESLEPCHRIPHELVTKYRSKFRFFYDEQLDLFDQDDQKKKRSEMSTEESASEAKPSIIEAIKHDRKGGDIGVVLGSSFHLDDDRGRRNTDYRYYLNLQHVMLKQFQLTRLRLFVLLDATLADLEAAIENENIDHIIVRGHGDWTGWTDNNGITISNKFIYLSDEENEDNIRKKKSFIRHTCGQPTIRDTFKDQLGTPFAHEVFGRACSADHIDDLLDPLSKTSPQEFLEQREKSRKEIDAESRWVYRKKRHKEQKKQLRAAKIKKIKEKIHAFFKKI